MTKALEHMLKLISLYRLHVIPLCSIDAHGKCTCGKPDCPSPGKHPHFKFNWKLTASNDPEKILQWTQKYKNLNWGVLTGRKSPTTNKFLTVIDADCQNHKLIKTFPSTFSYTTGQGRHFWYWSSKPVKNSVGQLAKHIDVRGSNGYVVIPPSKHSCGSSYKFDKAVSYNITDLPRGLIDKTPWSSRVITKRQACVGSVNTLNIKDPIWKIRKALSSGQKIAQGMRNTTIHRLLSSDRAKGADKEKLIKNAGYYKTMCEESSGVSNAELSCIINSVLKYPPNKNLANDIEVNEDVNHFFKNRLRHSEIFACPIREVKQAVHEHLNNHDLPYSYITDQWLAGQLERCGYKKKRTNAGNRWLLKII